MTLPVLPPLAPMLARSVPEIPEVGHYEPKWDGFRSIIFRDGDDVVLGSRSEKTLTRYFPEVVAAVRANTPERCVLDGEIVLPNRGHLDFEALQQRIHPAASRVQILAEQTPAAFVAFDLLALGSESLLDQPFARRREELIQALADADAPVRLTPVTTDIVRAQHWFTQLEGAGLDGVIAKPLTEPYQPNKRVMYKIKHKRTADCVVAGFRWHKSGPIIGSLLLGLYNDAGDLQHVGVAASFTMKRRAELLDELALYRLKPGTAAAAGHPWGEWADAAAHQTQRLPGNTSRWSAGKDLTFEALRPELVVEVAYDHMEGTRFRHTAQFQRWRPDRDPRTCTYGQLELPVLSTLDDIWG